MKKFMVLLIVLFATLTVFGQASKNAQDQQACEYARRKGNAEVWKNYLKQFPDGICAFEARAEAGLNSEAGNASKAEHSSATVNVTVITDKRCKDCRAEGLVGQLKGIFPGLVPEIIDYSEAKSKMLYKKFSKAGFSTLPIIAFEESVEKEEVYQKIARWTVKTGGAILLKVGAKFDPTKEICDNGIDDTGNGKVDCADNDCKEKMLCREEIPARIDLFVMSQCPYGIMALNSMQEVIEIFKDDGIDFHVNYIANETEPGKFQTLHGQSEVDENIRELCAAKHYPQDYMYYIWCRNNNIKDSNWQECATGRIRPAVIKKCAEGVEGRKLHSENIKIGNALDIGGSPTWIFNNKYQGSGVSVEDIVRQICTYNKDLKGCQQQ